MSSAPVVVEWSQLAIDRLRVLPKKVQKGLVRKARELSNSDPRRAGKPLTDDLAGCFRIPYGRYRLIYEVIDSQDEEGKKVVKVRVIFLMVGIRHEGGKRDIYREFSKMIRSGEIRLDGGRKP